MIETEQGPIKKIIVVAAVPVPSSRTRLSKLAMIIKEQEWSVEWWGWTRSAGEYPLAEYSGVRTILVGGGYANRKLALWYVAWMIRVFWSAVRTPGNPRFYCVGFDTAFPIAVAGLLRANNFLFDNADNISISYKWPKIVKWVLGKAERFVASRAKLHVLPTPLRWKGDRIGVRILPNYPARASLIQAKQLAATRREKRDDRLRLYVNGRLTRTRGLPQLVTALQLVPVEDVEVVVAGRINCPEAELLVQMDNVDYRGVISNAEALSLYFGCDLAFTYYDPAVPINRLAEPNKWWDCVATGTPFIANREIETARYFSERGACLLVPYHDSTALAEVLINYSAEPHLLDSFRTAMATISYVPWEDRMAEILMEL